MKEIEICDVYNDKGIYGIYSNDELLYIGKTNRSFKDRYLEHMKKLSSYICGNDIGGQYTLYERLYQEKRKGNNVHLEPIIRVSKLNIQDDSHRCRSYISNRDIECMELALIMTLKPVLNVEGRTKPYPLERI